MSGTIYPDSVDGVGVYSRVFLIANNPRITSMRIHNLGISDQDLVVQFNSCMHAQMLQGKSTIAMFQNNHLMSSWGFQEHGEPTENVSAVLQSQGHLKRIYFSDVVPSVVSGHLPGNVPVSVLSERPVAKGYPRSLKPSIGFLGYLELKRLVEQALEKPKLYLVGFSGMDVGLEETVYHDFRFEQWCIRNDPYAILVDPGPEDWSEIARRLHQLTGSVNMSALTRRDDIALLLSPGGVGVELGVAEGVFSERILRRSLLSYLFSIDMYAGDRGHDLRQYKRALKRLEPYRSRSSLIKLRFDEALDLFPDEYFDFVYVDGYAHTGEENGRTFYDWYPKLKLGGILAGDDYSPAWPRVVEEVDRFIARYGLPFYVIDCHEPGSSGYPTWFTVKV